MENTLNTETLASLGAKVATLCLGRYALPVRFRIRGRVAECRVPTWISVSELIQEAGEVALVAVVDISSALRWVFLRGSASVVENPDWAGLEPPECDRASPNDLYQVVRVEPRRIELIDERRDWGHRETLDM